MGVLLVDFIDALNGDRSAADWMCVVTAQEDRANMDAGSSAVGVARRGPRAAPARARLS